METTTRAQHTPMVDAVNVHVLDHLVNGPAAHRELMDAAQHADTINADLLAALEALTDALDTEMKHSADDGMIYPNEDQLASLLKTADASIAKARGDA